MKKAFTLLELVFVIVVIGILAVVILPSTKSNSLNEVANQLITDIRYTQHLAIVDDVYDKSKAHWYRGRWQLLFGKSENSSGKNTGNHYAYTIFSDYANTQTGKPGITEIAVNPLATDKLLSGGYSGVLDWEDKRATKAMNIGYKYNIDAISQSGCSAMRIAFDNKGRPYAGDDSSWNSVTDGILNQPCTFTLYQGDQNISIIIEPETGYVHLKN